MKINNVFILLRISKLRWFGSSSLIFSSFPWGFSKTIRKPNKVCWYFVKQAQLYESSKHTRRDKVDTVNTKHTFSFKNSLIINICLYICQRHVFDKLLDFTRGPGGRGVVRSHFPSVVCYVIPFPFYPSGHNYKVNLQNFYVNQW